MVGEAGIGKTALLDHLVEAACEAPVVRVRVIESEMELSFAGLHQLLVHFLDRIDALPGPQRAAIAAAFGLAEGDEPNTFLGGLAALTLLAEARGDDGFVVCRRRRGVARPASLRMQLRSSRARITPDGIGMVLGVRGADKGAGFDDLPELRIEGLTHELARGSSR